MKVESNKTYCRRCAPDEFPQGGLQNEGHLAIRLNHAECVRAKAFLDGVEVTNDCNEAVPGDPGLVVLFDRGENTKYRICDCSKGSAEHVERGQVTISMVLPNQER